MRKENISYFGRKVFIGIDVHLRSYSVTAVCDGEVVKRWKMEASAAELVEALE